MILGDLIFQLSRNLAWNSCKETLKIAHSPHHKTNHPFLASLPFLANLFNLCPPLQPFFNSFIFIRFVKWLGNKVFCEDILLIKDFFPKFTFSEQICLEQPPPQQTNSVKKFKSYLLTDPKQLGMVFTYDTISMRFHNGWG